MDGSVILIIVGVIAAFLALKFVKGVVKLVVLAAILRRRGQFSLDARLRRRLPRMAAAAAVMALTLWACERTVFEAAEAVRGLRWVGLAALVALGMGAYALAAQALGAFDVRELLRRVRRRGTGE